MSIDKYQYSPLPQQQQQQQQQQQVSTSNSISNNNTGNLVINLTTSIQTNSSINNTAALISLNEINNSIKKSSDEFKRDIQLRFLCPNDVNELKTLCSEWFPVDYPDAWYNDITSSTRFYSLAATYQNRIIGMIVAEIKLKRTTDKEDWYILSSQHPENTQVTYILSLGVFKEFRRLGIASLLLDTLIDYLKAETDCKAIYLHVLSSNQVAIRFYEKRNFQQRIYLPNYYTIKGQLQDGHCYVLYMNNGQPPCTLADCFKEAWSFCKAYNPIKIFAKSISIVTACLRNILFNLNRNYFTAKDFYRIS
jgi:N-alpha-acetyltransferase 60